MRLKKRVEQLEGRVSALESAEWVVRRKWWRDISRRLTQLECEHDPVPKHKHYSYFPWLPTTYCLECSKCGKLIRGLTEAEYLKARLARTTDQCATDKAAIKARLKVLKEGTNG